MSLTRTDWTRVRRSRSIARTLSLPPVSCWRTSRATHSATSLPANSGSPVTRWCRYEMIRSALKTSVLRFFAFAVSLHHAAHIPLHVGRQTAGLDEDVVEIKPEDTS